MNRNEQVKEARKRFGIDLKEGDVLTFPYRMPVVWSVKENTLVDCRLDDCHGVYRMKSGNLQCIGK